MSIYINDVFDYLDTHPVSRYEGDFQSLLEMLHEVYTMYNSIDSDEMHSLFGKLRPILESLSIPQEDQLFSAVCDLCLEHEQLAFSHGILVGMLLMAEVNMLP